MNRERLTILRDYLLELPKKTKGRLRPQKFNMNSWQSRSVRTKEGWCRTSACALGHACYIPEFKKAGLSISNDGFDIEFEGRYDFQVGQRFFGITEAQSEYLFDPDAYPEEMESYITPACVAFRIDEILEGKK